MTEKETLDNANKKLRPCPFCKEESELHYVELSCGLHYVECKRCGASPFRLGAFDHETAEKYWNRSDKKCLKSN